MATVESLQAHFRKVVEARSVLRAHNGVMPDQASGGDLKTLLLSQGFTEDCERFVDHCEDDLFQWLADNGDLDPSTLFGPSSSQNAESRLQHCIDKFSQLLSRSGINVSRPLLDMYTDKRKGANCGNTLFYPFAEPESDTIQINTAKHRPNIIWPSGADNDYVDDTLEEDVPMIDAYLTACHEMRHFFHISLGRAYKNFELNEGFRFYEDGKYVREMFRVHDGENGYIMSSDSSEYNKLQADERGAYLTGSRMAARFEAFNNKTPLPDFVRNIHPTAIPAQNEGTHAPAPQFV